MTRDRPTVPQRAGRAAGATLAVLVLWVALAAARPEVTYHLAPALIVWAAPWTFGGTDPRHRLATTGAGLAVAVGGATLLRAAGWLSGPVLFGGDALVEAVLVSVGAGLVASAAIVTAASSEGA